jgi:two-component system CheB/CheR fusion protein
MPTDHDPQFEQLLQFLKDSRGFDFTGYKRSSLMRRVERRMQQIAIGSYADYLDYLQLHPDEFTALFNMILINVTGFFRDSDAWTHLRDDVLPEMLAVRKPAEPLRVWSAGCASGEEAYTVAALLADQLGPEQFRERVKIYATDVDEDALAQARSASYSESSMKNVPAEYRQYFDLQGQRYNFRSDLRRSVIFGRNDLVQDAPISRVDLLLCRNALMYFNAETQARIVNRFHFAMSTDGVLFLGKAEMLLSHAELFQPIDLRRRFFRKVPRPAVAGARIPGFANGSTDVPPDLVGLMSLRSEALAAGPIATLLVDAGGTLAFSNPPAESLFGLSPRDVGRPFRDLEVSYRPVELRAYIDQVATERRSTWIRDVESTRGPGDSHFFDIHVAPLMGADGAAVGIALHFTDVTRYRKLQNELEVTNRQLETAYEELQSTNEELETMNEELQSTNDELQTINDELRDRTHDVHNANAFLEAILRSLHSGVIVVDPELQVIAWNRRAEDMWGLRADEAIGQHLLNLDVGLPVESLRPLVRNTLANGDPGEDLHLDAVNRRGRAIQIRVSSRRSHATARRAAARSSSSTRNEPRMAETPTEPAAGEPPDYATAAANQRAAVTASRRAQEAFDHAVQVELSAMGQHEDAASRHDEIARSHDEHAAAATDEADAARLRELAAAERERATHARERADNVRTRLRATGSTSTPSEPASTAE